MTEIWVRVPISPYRNYEVSNLGNIRREGRTLKTVRSSDGYLSVRLSYAGLARRFRINRLVCEAFHGRAPFPNADAAHVDGDKINNAASNLAWKTRKANIADKRRHGTAQIGEKAGGAKLTWDDVALLRKRVRDGEQITVVAKSFGISRSHAGNIASGSRNLWDDSAARQGLPKEPRS